MTKKTPWYHAVDRRTMSTVYVQREYGTCLSYNGPDGLLQEPIEMPFDMTYIVEISGRNAWQVLALDTADVVKEGRYRARREGGRPIPVHASLLQPMRPHHSQLGGDAVLLDDLR